MNKAFEKILEELEKYKYSHLVERTSKQLMHCKEVGDCGMLDCSLCIFDKAIKIVQQVVEEYNNGWIPCSERLPTAEEFQRGNGRFLVTDGNRTYEAEYDIYESHTFVKSQMASNWFVTDNCVTHWQNEPLPEPYHPKGENPKKTNFDICRESMEAMAQIIDIAKIGWTKEQIMEWLQKEAE